MKKNVIRICAIISGVSGVTVLLWVMYPIIAYEFSAPSSQSFLSPIANDTSIKIVGTKIDDTKVSNWFPNAKQPTNYAKPAVSFYKISIPRLNIRNASVSIGGEDLAQSLIQYPGTALPGKIGNAAIFGHSVLPAFYNPLDYMTIFSTLPTLVKGDIITVNYDGITYKYQVEEKYEVEPSDIQVLDQDESDSFLTLVTCVPPGLVTRRLIVKARIVPVRG